MSEITQVFEVLHAGDPQAASRLLPLVYDELRRLAALKMAEEDPDHSLDATALVHEAWKVTCSTLITKATKFTEVRVQGSVGCRHHTAQKLGDLMLQRPGIACVADQTKKGTPIATHANAN
jgi:hypothetical protein